MRGQRFTLAIGVLVATALLGACTGNGSTTTTSAIGIQAAAGSSTGAANATSGQSGSAPVVTAPVATAPSLPVPATGTGNTTGGPSPTSPVVTPLSPPASTSSAKRPVISPASFSISPKPGSTQLSPRTPIVIRATHGTLDGVELVNAEGNAAKGALSTDRTTWTLAEPLGYDATYQLRGRAVAKDGPAATIRGTYQTVNPDGVISASISPDVGSTVGIGAPILISLGTDITNTTGRQNIERAITVTTVPKTQGAFGWIQHDDGWGLDWRPKGYWTPGTKVTVTAKLYGVDYGNGLYGQQDLQSSFTIGRSEITRGDIGSHRLKVYRDGKLLFDFPTSYGLESDPGRVTHGGTYVVMSKEYLHLMSNPAYHYKNFKAYYAVRISDNGTFIHANDGTADVQGYDNVTHGCANLTTTNAKLFYDQTMYGDPVEITGSTIPMSQSDGDIYDWSFSWTKWQTLSALSASYAG